LSCYCRQGFDEEFECRFCEAQLVVACIQAIEPQGVPANDGRLHELDVLVLVTGF